MKFIKILISALTLLIILNNEYTGSQEPTNELQELKNKS